MKVQITKAFRWARDGIYVEDLHVGDVVEGRPAEIALEQGWGRSVEDATGIAPHEPPAAAPPTPPPPGPQSATSEIEVTATRVIGPAPSQAPARRRGR
jgi:hypothetical protein